MALFSGVFPFKVAFSNARDAFKGDNWNNSSDNVQLNASTMEAIKDDCENFFFLFIHRNFEGRKRDGGNEIFTCTCETLLTKTLCNLFNLAKISAGAYTDLQALRSAC